VGQPRTISLRDFATAAQPSPDQNRRDGEGYAADQLARAVVKVVVTIGGEGIVAHDVDRDVREYRPGRSST
jgi:hypothetical protein